jgi:hypothetical protein
MGRARPISHGHFPLVGAEDGAAKQYEERRRQLPAETAAVEERRRALYQRTLDAYHAIREADGKRGLSYRWIPLDANIPDDPQVKSMIDAYRQESP